MISIVRSLGAVLCEGLGIGGPSLGLNIERPKQEKQTIQRFVPVPLTPRQKLIQHKDRYSPDITKRIDNLGGLKKQIEDSKIPYRWGRSITLDRGKRFAKSDLGKGKLGEEGKKIYREDLDVDPKRSPRPAVIKSIARKFKHAAEE